MTIKKRLARSNIAMLVIPVLTAAVLLFIGMTVAFELLKYVYLPRLGVSFHDLHQTGEQLEDVLSGFGAMICIYAGAVAAALLLTIVLTNIYLTRMLFRHISGPLDLLVAGVARVRDGDLDTPIAYGGKDEFKAACDAVDEMALRLKTSLEQQQEEQQKKQELIAGMSHDLKSPLTSIRAYTEALLDGVARDEQARRRYLETIHAKEIDIEGMVGRLFEFAKMETGSYPVHAEALPLSETLGQMINELGTGGMEIGLDIPDDLGVTADRELIGRVVSNILTNSRKYGGRDDLRVDISARETGGMAEVSFSDNGAGVPAEQLSKLFDLVLSRGRIAHRAGKRQRTGARRGQKGRDGNGRAGPRRKCRWRGTENHTDPALFKGGQPWLKYSSSKTTPISQP